jgi:hypothetical protein
VSPLMPGVAIIDVVTDLNRGSRIFRDPYDSPRILKALLDQIVEDVNSYFAYTTLTNQALYAIQACIDDQLRRTDYRGIPLNAGIRILAAYQGGSSIELRITPVSEDGRFWLSCIDELESPPPTMVVPVEEPPPSITAKRVICL